MPSFDIVSKIKKDELQNAVENTQRELANRYDFRGTDSTVELDKQTLAVKLNAPEEFQIRQIDEILLQKLSKRGLDMKSASLGEVTRSGKRSLQQVTFKEGIDRDLAKKIIKVIKDAGLKVDAKQYDDAVRVTGKKKDDLQSAIAAVRAASLEQPVQFENFRD
ncbi:MAG: YajQ family cyclic di-GMP-binding protein [Succinivibrio sp.]|nr:YajQ family cyclic di-GMP-binding protein [Succinivibrio sp.]